MIVPGVAVVGLIFVAWISLSLLSGNLPWKVRTGPGSSLGPPKTPTPSNIVVVPSTPPEDKLAGSIIYAKAGNIWIQDATGARQVTSAGGDNIDSMPSFTADGRWIVYIETRTQVVTYTPPGGTPTHYTATYPILYEIHPDGSGRVKLTDGLFTSSRGTWFYWLRQPVMSPDGKTIALFSDGPNPDFYTSEVVLQFFDVKTGRLTSAGAPSLFPFGHQDAAWSPDGLTLLYVKNGRDGTRGAPQINKLDWKTKKIRAVTGPGYNAPQWSPDGKYIVATKTSSIGTDVVILDARTGNEIARITDDAKSWAGIWSPAGDAIAYLHIEGGVTDLQMVKLTGTPGRWTVGDPIALTDAAGLDGASHPDWFIPADQLPAPTPSPTPSAAASPSPGSGSSAP
jgi:Tol biopolymer transport system component